MQPLGVAQPTARAAEAKANQTVHVPLAKEIFVQDVATPALPFLILLVMLEVDPSDDMLFGRDNTPQ